MGLSSGFESNAIGGMGGYGIGGFGGGGIIEGLLLGTLLRGRGGVLGGDGECAPGVTSLDADGIAAKTALLINQNADQNALLGAIAGAKDQTISEGRALAAAVCQSEVTNLQQFYANAVQQARLAQDIQNQASAIAIVNDKRFDDAQTQASNNTAAILSRINDVENQGLRDQLFEARRGRDAKETEITINNSANAVAQQQQAQFQVQTQRDNDLHRRLDSVFASFNQLNRNTQDVINFGTMAASANQANTQTNIK
jgi:hypothetical protein